MNKPGYINYTNDELLDAFANIDDEKHPDRASEILNMIELRFKEVSTKPSDKFINKLISTISILTLGFDVEAKQQAFDIKATRVRKRR
ncbi:hypothetical protein [Pseudoalteromonas tunicata]|uniref:hypothetical protein n=1 Tax=Pseudoalteromonas tunicata TaxID=314281 RepID=UPI00273FD160|nr:hypothetical protein [Pseudoalteromonas tunicata]MDP4984077.1 hypothetical protein [Pseudoalteromonas tunicata]